MDLAQGTPFDVLIQEDLEPIKFLSLGNSALEHHVLATVKVGQGPAIVVFHPTPNTHVVLSRFHLNKFNPLHLLKNGPAIHRERVSNMLHSIGEDSLAATFDLGVNDNDDDELLSSQAEGLSKVVAMSMSLSV